MKKAKYLVILVLLLLVTGCGKSNLKEITYDEYKTKIKNKETFILEIMRTDCSACKSFKPKLTEVLDKYNITVYYINTDEVSNSESEQIFSDLSVSGTPTVIFYNKGEEETTASRIVGSVSTDKIIEKFKANDIIKD